MSHPIYSDFFTRTSPISNFSRDGSLFITPIIETSTFDYPQYTPQPFPPYLTGSTGAILGYQYDAVQNIEFPPLMARPGHGTWSNEHSQGHVDLTGPYSALNHLHNQALAPHTNNVGLDGLTPTIVHTEHHGDQTHHMSIVSGSPQLEYLAPVAPDLNNDDPLGHTPLEDNVAGPSRGSPSPVRSRMWDDEDEDLKRLASQYLNNPDSYVNRIRIDDEP